MADFGFVGPSYEAPSIYQDGQECINFRAEVDPLKEPGSRGVVSLYPTPGLTSALVFQNNQQVRGLRTLSGGNFMLAVVGPYLYLINNTLNATIVGQLSSSAGPVSITDNGVYAYIVDGNNRYSWKISQPLSATFIGSLSGTTLTVVLIKSGVLATGMSIFGSGLSSETVITSQTSGVPGSVGTYTVNQTQTETAEIINASTVGCNFIGSINGNILTVSNIVEGNLYLGQTIQGPGVTLGTVITALGSETVLTAAINTAGTGYAVNDVITVLGGIYGNFPSTYTVNSVNVGVATVGTISGGSSYTNGTYYNVQMTYVSGPVATTYPSATIVVSGGAVSSVSITSPGLGFTNTGTVLSAPSTSIGGTGSGFTVSVATLTSTGAVTSLTQTSPGQYTSLPNNPASTSTNGTGTGLTLNLTFGSGSGGTGNYVLNNSQTVASQTMFGLNFSIIPSSDGAFQGANTVDTVDNYFVYNDPNSQQWAASNILSPITSALSFSSKDGSPDNLVSLIVDHREVYLMGEKSSEVWVDVGTFPFPFQRIPGTSTQHGIAAQFSLSRVGNSFAYVSRNNRGQAQIMQMNGYIPQRISTHAVENTLVDQYVDDAIAWTYQLEGHEVYVVSFPTIDLTWAYDATTNMWHKWLWVDNNNVYHRHRGNCSTVFQGLVYVGDWQNGILYQLDSNNYTDNGQEIRRLRRAPHLVTDLQRQYLEEFQIQFQPGVGLNGLSKTTYSSTSAVAGLAIAGRAIAGTSSLETVGANPQAMLRWSNDGGSTWSNEHWTSIGQIGKYKNRAIWRRLGWSRDRVFEVVVTDPVKSVIISANLKASEGEN